MLRFLLVMAIGVGVSACSGVDDTFNTVPADIRQTAAVERIYVATSRQPDSDPRTMFSSGRSKRLSFAELDIGVPANHRPGQVEAVAGGHDPARHFSLVASRPIGDPAAFRGDINAVLQTRKPEDRELFVFIHGYNNNFVSGVFRQAQMAYDFDAPGISIHYAWPSAGRPDGYAYDRDSATFAQNGLAELLVLAASTDARRIMVFAHSMGSLIATQALRLLAAAGDTGTLERLDIVVLAAPDVDVDVFDTMLSELGPQRPDPFVVMVSRRDRALRLSSRVRGGSPRVGEGRNVEFLQANGITVLDVSNIDRGGHGTFGNSPTLIRMARSGKLEGTLQSARENQLSSTTVREAGSAGSLLIRLPRTAIETVTGAGRN